VVGIVYIAVSAAFLGGRFWIAVIRSFFNYFGISVDEVVFRIVDVAGSFSGLRAMRLTARSPISLPAYVEGQERCLY
jgi:hypothetical protein